MRNPLRRKSLNASPTVVEAVRDRRTNLVVPLGGQQAGFMANAAFLRGQSAAYGWLYAHRPAVRMVIDYIARNVSQLPLKCYERVSDNERERSTDHPAMRTLERPNEGQSTGDQFIQRLVTDFLVYDQAYVLKFRGGPDGQLFLHRLPPPMVQVAGGLFTADLYRVFRVDGSWFDVMPQDMISWHGYNPDDALLGLSKLETLRDSLTEDQVSQATTLELMRNGLKGGHIERPLEAPDWSQGDGMQRFRESWRNQRSQSPKLDPVLEEGMKWVPTAITPKDAELLAGRRWTVEEVSAVYGVPLEVLMAASDAGGDLAEARKQVYQDVLPPITGDLASQFDQDLLVAEYFTSKFYFEFDLNEKMRGDPVARFAAITSAVGAPWLLRNEARSLENRPPIDGGDELITPLNVLVGDEPRPAPNVMPPQDPNGPPQDGSHRETPKAIVVAVDEERAVDSTAVLLETKAASSPVPQLVPRRKADLGRQQRYIAEMEALMEKFYARQARALRKKAVQFDAARWDRELGTDLNTLLFSIVEREGGFYVARLAGDDFDMGLVTNYLKAMSKGAAEAINEVTVADIEEVGLDDAMSRASNERAAVAAASLGARSTIFARMEAAKQAPHYDLRTKTWVADTERHAEFDGDTVPIGAEWPAGFAPGSPANCGCTASID